MKKTSCWFTRAILFALLIPAAVTAAGATRGRIVTEQIDSTVLRDNRVNLETNRLVKIYLPPSYAESPGRSYPVVYFCHSLNWGPKLMFEDGNLVGLIERGFAAGTIPEFILVAADYSTTGLGTLYENSSTSGRWRDFTTEEVVPFIDGRFRTFRRPESRGLVGDFMGGRGALNLAMSRPDLFGSVYALHPVATGTGTLPITYLDVDWAKIQTAKKVEELTGPGRSQIFALVCQAFLPNPNRPPLYCDFPMELQNGTLRIHPDNNRKLQKGFLLEETLDEAAANLRRMRGIAFDWGRYDPTQAHVFANQVFSRKLDDLGIEHEAEEYRGNPWDKNWTPQGRFATRVLPFFARHLVFE